MPSKLITCATFGAEAGRALWCGLHQAGAADGIGTIVLPPKVKARYTGSGNDLLLYLGGWTPRGGNPAAPDTRLWRRLAAFRLPLREQDRPGWSAAVEATASCSASRRSASTRQNPISGLLRCQGHRVHAKPVWGRCDRGKRARLPVDASIQWIDQPSAETAWLSHPPPVAQWIEQRFPKPRAQVRFLSGASCGAPMATAHAPVAAERTGGLCTARRTVSGWAAGSHVDDENVVHVAELDDARVEPT